MVFQKAAMAAIGFRAQSRSYVAGRHPASAQSSTLTAALVIMKQMASAISSGLGDLSDLAN
jgi:hypothetical protein